MKIPALALEATLGFLGLFALYKWQEVQNAREHPAGLQTPVPALEKTPVSVVPEIIAPPVQIVVEKPSVARDAEKVAAAPVVASQP